MCTDNLGKISSQWDGLRHYRYQNLKKYYNGATRDDIDSSSTLGIEGCHAFDPGTLTHLVR
jgi:hypothetical protein